MSGEKTERIRRVLASLCEEAKMEFTRPLDVRMTVLARTPWLPDGDGDVLVSDDEDRLVLAAFCRLSGVPFPEAAVDAVAQLLERVVAKCQQYENAPRLEAAEQHAVNEWIERQARAALSLLRPGEDGEDGRDG